MFAKLKEKERLAEKKQAAAAAAAAAAPAAPSASTSASASRSTAESGGTSTSTTTTTTTITTEHSSASVPSSSTGVVAASGRAGKPQLHAASSLEALFEAIDTNGDGTLTRAELFSALRGRGDVDQLLGFPEGGGSVTEIMDFFDAVDADKDRLISLKEFRVGVKKWKRSKGFTNPLQAPATAAGPPAAKGAAATETKSKPTADATVPAQGEGMMAAAPKAKPGATTPAKAAGGMFSALTKRLGGAIKSSSTPSSGATTPTPESPPKGSGPEHLATSVAVPDGAETVSREQYDKLLKKAQQMRGKLVELKTLTQDLTGSNEKLQNQLTSHQDRALRRISELKEAYRLDQQAKAHLASAFEMRLEEKDEMSKVLQTQIEALKIQLADKPQDSKPASESEEMQGLRDQVSRMESLLTKCKEAIKSNKDKVRALTMDKANLQQELAASRMGVAAPEKLSDGGSSEGDAPAAEPTAVEVVQRSAVPQPSDTTELEAKLKAARDSEAVALQELTKARKALAEAGSSAQTELKQAQAEGKRLTAELESASATGEQMRTKAKELLKALKAARKDIEARQAADEGRKETDAATQADLERLQAECQELRSLAEAKASEPRPEEQALEAKLAAMAETLAARDAEADQLQATVNDLQAQAGDLAALQGELQTKQGQLTASLDQAATLRDQVDELAAANRKLVAASAAGEMAAEAQASQALEAAQRSNAELTAATKASDERAAALEAKAVALQAELDAARAANEALEAASKTLSATQRGLEERLDVAQQCLSPLRSAKAEAERKLGVVSAELDARDRQREELSNSLTASKQTLLRKESELSMTLGQLQLAQAAKEKCAELEQRLLIEQDAAAATAATRETAIQEAGSLASELDAQRAALQEANDRAARLEADLSGAKERATSLEASAGDATKALSEELAAAKARATGLEKELAAAVAETSTARELATSLEASAGDATKALSEELAAEKARATGLEKELAAAVAETSTARELATSLEASAGDATKALSEELAAAKARATGLEKELAAAGKLQEQVDVTVAKLREKVKAVIGERRVLKKQLSEAEAKLAAAASPEELERSQEEARASSEASKRQLDEADTLRASLASGEAERASLQGRLEQATTEAAAKAAELSRVDAERREQATSLENLMTSVLDLEKHMAQANQDAAEHAEQLDRLRTDLAASERRNQLLSAAVESGQERVAALEGEGERLRSELKASRLEHSKASSTASQYERVMDKAKTLLGELKAAKDTIAALELQTAEQAAQLEGGSARLAELEAARASDGEAAGKLRAEREKLQAELQRAGDGHAQALAESEAQRSALAQEVDTLSGALDAKTKQLQRLGKESKVLRRELSGQSRQVSELEASTRRSSSDADIHLSEMSRSLDLAREQRQVEEHRHVSAVDQLEAANARLGQELAEQRSFAAELSTHVATLQGALRVAQEKRAGSPGGGADTAARENGAPGNGPPPTPAPSDDTALLLGRAEEELQRMTEQRDDAAGRLSALEAEIKTLQQSSEQAGGRQEAGSDAVTTAAIRELEESKQFVEEELEEVLGELREGRAAQQAMEAELGRLKQQNSELQERIDEVQEKLAVAICQKAAAAVETTEVVRVHERSFGGLEAELQSRAPNEVTEALERELEISLAKRQAIEDTLEYLKSVTYKYMMGEHPRDLARVIGTILDFTPQQLNAVTSLRSDKGWLSAIGSALSPAKTTRPRTPSLPGHTGKRRAPATPQASVH